MTRKEQRQAAGYPDLEGRILYVEDYDGNVAVMEELLSVCPRLSLHFAGDGVAAMKCLDTERYDVVLLDLHLPDMNGRDVLRALRTEGMNRATPVAVVTADALGSSRNELMGFGADVYLAKPLVRGEVINVLSRLLVGAGLRKG